MWHRAVANTEVPFLILRLPSDEIAVTVGKRVVLVKMVVELWGAGLSIEEVLLKIDVFPCDYKNRWMQVDSQWGAGGTGDGGGGLFYIIESTEFLLQENISWSMMVDAFGVCLSMESQQLIRDKFKVVPIRGRVDLKNPDCRFWIFQGFFFHNSIVFYPSRCWWARHNPIINR